MAEPKIETRNETSTTVESFDTRPETKPQPIVETESRHKVDGLTDITETKQRVPQEIKTWLQQIEEDPGQMKTVHDDSGQPVLVPTPNQNPKVVLPITRAKFVDGFKKKVNEASRWLSGFLLKLIKKKKGNVKFKQE